MTTSFDLPKFVGSLGALEQDIEVVVLEPFAEDPSAGLLRLKMPGHARELRIGIFVRPQKNFFTLYADLDISGMVEVHNEQAENRLNRIINVINLSTWEFGSKVSVQRRSSGELAARVNFSTHLPSEYFAEQVESLRIMVRQNLVLIIDEAMTMVGALHAAWDCEEPHQTLLVRERVLN